MQTKIFISSFIALAISHAIANPVPGELNEDSPPAARSFNLDLNIPDNSEIFDIRTRSYTWANTQINISPSTDQINLAKQWFGASFPDYYTQPGCYWTVDVWSYFYCYQTYPTYVDYWHQWNPFRTSCYPGLYCS